MQVPAAHVFVVQLLLVRHGLPTGQFGLQTGIVVLVVLEVLVVVVLDVVVLVVVLVVVEVVVVLLVLVVLVLVVVRRFGRQCSVRALDQRDVHRLRRSRISRFDGSD